MNIAICIKHLYPNLGHSEWKVSDENGTQVISKWPEGLAKPTTEALSTAWAEASAKQEAKQVAADLLVALKAAYANFSDGGKWAFGSAYDTVVNHIRRGDIAAAKLTVQMIQIPAEVPETSPEELATWTAKKAEILALFP